MTKSQLRNIKYGRVIKLLKTNRYTDKELATKFNLSTSTIWRIKKEYKL